MEKIVIDFLLDTLKSELENIVPDSFPSINLFYKQMFNYDIL